MFVDGSMANVYIISRKYPRGLLRIRLLLDGLNHAILLWCIKGATPTVLVGTHVAIHDKC